MATTSQAFHTRDMVRLEVEDEPTGLVNLIQNPSGELGGWGWVTPVANSAMTRIGTATNNPRLQFKWAYLATGAAMYCRSELMPVTAGQYVAASWNSHSGDSALGFKLRFEWYDTNRALLSSSTQGAWMNAAGAGQYAPVVAPVGAKHMAARLDFSSTAAGAAPPSSATWNLSRMTVATAASASALGAVRTNLLANPSAEANTAGWAFNDVFASLDMGTVATSTTRAVSGTRSLQATLPASTKGTALLATVPTVVGGWYVFSGSVWVPPDAPAIRATALFISDSAWITTKGAWARIEVRFKATGTTTHVGFVTATGAASTYFADAFMVEESTDVGTAGTYFDGSTTASQWVHAWKGTAHESQSTATSSALPYIQPVPFRNVIGPTLEARVSRFALNLGTLTATLRDTTLDPSTSSLIRPGRRVRLTAKQSDGSWSPLFVGEMKEAKVTYDVGAKVPMSKQAKIEISAHDGLGALANQTRPQGVGTVDGLPFVLEGAGIPWNCNGSGNQVGTATVVSTNPNSSAADQLAITRDSTLGEAWLDRHGVVQAWDRAKMPTTPLVTIGSNTYSDVDVQWASGDCVNEVNVILLRHNLARPGETVEVPYGPYRDEASVRQWGPMRPAAPFTVHGLADTPAAIQAYANEILTANATPKRRVESITIPIKASANFDPSSPASVFRDVCDRVNVVNAKANVSADLLVRSVEHVITPKRWTMQLGFGSVGAVAMPTMAPPVQSAPLVATGWQSLTLINGWENFGSAYANAAYRIDGDRVTLRGLIKNGSLGVSLTSLPVTARPPNSLLLPVLTNSRTATTGAASTGTAHTHPVALVDSTARLYVDSLGACLIQPTGTSVATGYISLDGVSWFTN